MSVALVVGLAPSAGAHSTSEYINLWTPVVGSTSWARTQGTDPASHHIVYRNWGLPNDWSVDLFATAGSRVVSPFGSKASNGQATRVTVISVKPGCRTGNVADGGYQITLEARNAVTGTVIGRADLMHVANPQVAAGSVVGPWTTLGYLSQFRYTSCYQVSTPQGVHLHLEMIDQHKYSCYHRRANGTPISENTIIGRSGAHYGGQRAAC